MRFWTFVKLLAALAVLGIMLFTGMLAYHVTMKPLGGIFERIIPNPHAIVRDQPDAEFAKMLDSAELPDIDPGEKAFQKAHELIAMGQLSEAREKLNAIINVFPTSPSAPIARRIVGDMNLDEILSSANMEGKETYTVKRGDSYIAIANRNKTTLEMILHLNGMMGLGALHPGDDLILMPLDFRLLIDSKKQTVSLWQGGKFLREYPILLISAPSLAPQKTRIDSKGGMLNGRRIAPEAKGYRGSDKIIQLAKLPLPIRAYEPDDDDRPRGIFLDPADLEELCLLTRAGNEVEIR